VRQKRFRFAAGRRTGENNDVRGHFDYCFRDGKIEKNRITSDIG
jgi:hypothetical protein